MIKTNAKVPNRYSAPLVYKTFAVLKQVANEPSELGVSDIARQLQLNKSTVFGITQALLDLGILQQDGVSKKFRLGPGLIQLANHSMSLVNLTDAARPFLQQLSQKFWETVFLGRMDENGITIVEKADSPALLKISAPEGTRIPFFAGAAAKSFLAFLEDSALRRILEKKELPSFTEKSPTSTEKYLAELLKVRQKGFATDFEEYMPGVNAISVPLFGPRGLQVAAIWIVGFSRSFDADKMHRAAKAAVEAAGQISVLLGG